MCRRRDQMGFHQSGLTVSLTADTFKWSHFISVTYISVKILQVYNIIPTHSHIQLKTWFPFYRTHFGFIDNFWSAARPVEWLGKVAKEEYIHRHGANELWDVYPSTSNQLCSMGCYGCFTLFRFKVSAEKQNKGVKLCKKFLLNRKMIHISQIVKGVQRQGLCFSYVYEYTYSRRLLKCYASSGVNRINIREFLSLWLRCCFLMW